MGGFARRRRSGREGSRVDPGENRQAIAQLFALISGWQLTEDEVRQVEILRREFDALSQAGPAATAAPLERLRQALEGIARLRGHGDHPLDNVPADIGQRSAGVADRTGITPPDDRTSHGPDAEARQDAAQAARIVTGDGPLAGAMRRFLSTITFDRGLVLSAGDAGHVEEYELAGLTVIIQTLDSARVGITIETDQAAPDSLVALTVPSEHDGPLYLLPLDSTGSGVALGSIEIRVAGTGLNVRIAAEPFPAADLTRDDVPAVRRSVAVAGSRQVRQAWLAIAAARPVDDAVRIAISEGWQ